MALPFLTTIIGSLPKPGWLYRRSYDPQGVGADWLLEGAALREAQDDAVRLAVFEQERAGIDVVTDGEQRRKSFITDVTRGLEGFDYRELVEKPIRGGRRMARVGRCVGAVRWRGPVLVDDARFLVAAATRPVKVTMPGPMTVVDSSLDTYYHDERAMAADVAAALNEEALALAAAGVSVIQFDEPAFSRYPDKVAEWGIAMLDCAVAGVTAHTAIHVCYGYPVAGIDRPVVPSYHLILPELERSQVGQLALEFEAPQLDPKVLAACPSKTVLFGGVAVVNDTVEDPEHIARRLHAAAEYHPPEKLQVAPDCGMTTLDRSVARAKLRAMCEGARLARERL